VLIKNGRIEFKIRLLKGKLKFTKLKMKLTFACGLKVI